MHIEAVDVEAAHLSAQVEVSGYMCRAISKVFAEPQRAKRLGDHQLYGSPLPTDEVEIVLSILVNEMLRPRNFFKKLFCLVFEGHHYAPKEATDIARHEERMKAYSQGKFGNALCACDCFAKLLMAR